MGTNEQQTEKVRSGGFIAALDQSGGSTPKALRLYGIDESEYSGEDAMFDLVHAMRTRIITSPAFTGKRVMGAILFEGTMDRDIEGKPSARYLWDERGVVPFLKVDKGLAPEADGVQIMKPIPGLDATLERAKTKGIFGTKMRSVIKMADAKGVKANIDQQFTIGNQIADSGLMPILEPEIDIHSPQKAEAEALLKKDILENLGTLPAGRKLMFKLTLPETADFYRELIDHPAVLKVVALSGGYTREEANDRLRQNHGMVASFSRALVEGLTVKQSDADFNAMLDASIQSIYEASMT